MQQKVLYWQQRRLYFPEENASIPLSKNSTSAKSIVANFTVAHVIITRETNSSSMSLHECPLLRSTLLF
jgi:hypothetical protein